MSRILVYKCDQTGKLFEDGDKYRAHLRKLARARANQRKIDAANAVADEWWNAAYNREMTISEYPQWVIDNQQQFWLAAAKHGWAQDWKDIIAPRGNKEPLPWPEIVEFTNFDVRWSERVSNTHSCPHNGVMNWGCRETYPDGTPKPVGYPGWSGRAEWIIRWPQKHSGRYLGAELFNSKRARAHTGTGGGGGVAESNKYGCSVQKFGYSFILYAADWPGMVRAREEQLVINRLKGQAVFV